MIAIAWRIGIVGIKEYRSTRVSIFLMTRSGAESLGAIGYLFVFSFASVSAHCSFFFCI